MPKFDPSTNGHKMDAQPERPRPGKGVLMVAVVSALTGFSLMLGAALGGLVALPLGLKGKVAGAVLYTAAGAGGVLGAIFGVRVAHRFGGAGGSSRARIWGVLGGVAGLFLAVALSAKVVNSMVPIIAVMLPGVGAWLGDRLAERTV